MYLLMILCEVLFLLGALDIVNLVRSTIPDLRKIIKGLLLLKSIEIIWIRILLGICILLLLSLAIGN